MKPLNLNTAAGIAQLIEAQLHLAKKKLLCETELFGKEPERGVGKSTSMANFDTSKAIIIDDITGSKHKPEQKHIIAKQGRNELCACGSGKKHKNCCLKS